MTFTFILAANSTLVDGDGLNPVYCEVNRQAAGMIVNVIVLVWKRDRNMTKRSLHTRTQCTNRMNIQGISIK
jgi:hypothetical protein